MRSFTAGGRVARAIVLGGLAVATWGVPALAGDDVSRALDVSRLAPGMMIYLDPRTGALSAEPAPDAIPLQLTPAVLDALRSSDQGLVEVPNPVPGGGVAVDLQGRFQTPLFAIVGPDGKVQIRHSRETPEAATPK